MDIMLERIIELLGCKHGDTKKLAAYIGISANSISDWKAGRAKSYTKYAAKIAAYYGVSLDWLTGLSDIKNPPAVSDEGKLNKELVNLAELSSASVPFPFDVHAMIFSEDAPGLENILHQYFDSGRVNKVNSRKEFFKVDLDAIKDVVLKNHNATVKFVDIPDATEYRETLKIEESAAKTAVKIPSVVSAAV